MRSHSLNVLGIDISFKAKTDPERVEQARLLLEERFEKLRQHSSSLSKEKLLTFLALALADDYLLLRESLETSEEKLQHILFSIESSAAIPSK